MVGCFTCLHASLSDLTLRDHVSLNYWPNKDASGAKLQLMFNKVMEANKASKGP